MSDVDMPGLIAWLRSQLDDDEPTADPADVRAKRDLLDAWENRGEDPGQPFDRGYAEGLVTAIRILGTGYADRPGYSDLWRP